MKKPQSLKQAFNQNFVVRDIYDGKGKKVRIDLKPRSDNQSNLYPSFWIDRNYFKRTYPNLSTSYLIY